MVVLYNPDPELLARNIASFSDCVDHILLWRNSPFDAYFPKTEPAGDETNQGISVALNFAAAYAVSHGYDYLLTMDQDSVWKDFPSFLSLALSEDAPEGLYGARLDERPQPDYVQVLNLITSGMLIPVHLLKRIGGWRTDFKVDCLDVDFVLHAESMGIHSYRLGAGSLIHRFGNRQRVKGLFYVYNYPPQRLYTIFRNHILVFREYGKIARSLKRVFVRTWVWHRVPRIILGEKPLVPKLKAIIRGARDGFSAPVPGKPRVALVTWFNTPNYGTTIQAYATVRALRFLGTDPFVVFRYLDPVNLKAVKDNWNRKHGIRRFWKQEPAPWPVKIRRIRQFCKKEIPVYYVVTKRDLSRLKDSTGLFLAGSDQLWNCRDHFQPFEFLAFADGCRKAAFSTSIGTGSIPGQYREKVREYLSGFGPISLREASGVREISGITGRNDIVQVADPTFLLTASQWREIGTGAVEEPYVLVYLLKWHEETEGILARTGISNIIIVPSGENPMLSLSVPGASVTLAGDAGIREFIGLLANAALVLTDSYHGVALSANLGREFIILKRFSDSDPDSQNDRVYDLCRRLSAEDRIWSGTMPSPTDKAAMQQRVSAMRDEAFAQLKKTVG